MLSVEIKINGRLIAEATATNVSPEREAPPLGAHHLCSYAVKWSEMDFRGETFGGEQKIVAHERAQSAWALVAKIAEKAATVANGGTADRSNGFPIYPTRCSQKVEDLVGRMREAWRNIPEGGDFGGVLADAINAIEWTLGELRSTGHRDSGAELHELVDTAIDEERNRKARALASSAERISAAVRRIFDEERVGRAPLPHAPIDEVTV